jgi:uncharacterized membrane protein YfcA
VLIFLGLPPTVANGTNRVGILLQNVGAVWGFHRYRLLDWRWTIWAALPATVGAGLGTWTALHVGDEAFRKILALLMVVVTLWTLIDPLKKRRAGTDGETPRARVPTVALLFLGVGFYGGFVQAGVGFFLLAVLTLAGIDLVRGNAIKVLCILIFTVLSLAIFAANGSVDWGLGLALGVGTTLGGQLGVHLTALKGHDWVKGVVTVTVIVFALRLWLVP